MNLRKKWNTLSENRRKVLCNVAWAMLGKAISMLGVLFVGILVGRYLGPEKYGLMNYVISFVALFEVLSEFGLEFIEVRELAKKPDERNEIMGTCFGMRLAFAVIAYLLLLGIVSWVESDLYTRKMIAAYGICLFAFPYNIARTYFTSIVENEYVVKSQILRTIVGAFIKIILLWKKMSLTCFILAAAFDYYLLAVGYAQAYRKRVGHIREWRFEIQRVPFLLKEAFPLLLACAAVVVYQRIDQVMIKHLVNQEGVGYFATASMFLNVILFLPMVLVRTVTPLLVKIRKDSEISYRKMAERTTGCVVWTSAIMALSVTLFAPFMIFYTYGAEYIEAVPVLQVLAWKTVGMALSSISGHLIIIEGTQKLTAVRDIMGCITCVGLNWFILPRWGVMGAAWTTIITVAMSGFFTNFFIPSYRHIFRLQVRSLVLGWRELFLIRSLFFEKDGDSGGQHGTI